MLLSQVAQQREDDRGCGGGGIEILVADRGVQIWVGGGLDLLKHAEEPTQCVGNVGAVGIAVHSQDLPWERYIFLPEIVAFQNGGPPSGDLALCPDAQLCAVEESGGIGGAGQNGAHEVTGGLG